MDPDFFGGNSGRRIDTQPNGDPFQLNARLRTLPPLDAVTRIKIGLICAGMHRPNGMMWMVCRNYIELRCNTPGQGENILRDFDWGPAQPSEENGKSSGWLCPQCYLRYRAQREEDQRVNHDQDTDDNSASL